MRRLLVFFILFSLFSCEKIVDKPKNLIEKQEMAEIIADFAIYDQTYTVKPDANMELVSRFVLKKHKIDAKTYRDSYKYYISNPEEMDDIFAEAKEIILDKDPKLEDYIEKKKKENPNLPEFLRYSTKLTFIQ